MFKPVAIAGIQRQVQVLQDRCLIEAKLAGAPRPGGARLRSSNSIWPCQKPGPVLAPAIQVDEYNGL